MDDAKISNVIFTVLAHDHELGLPELLVVGDLVVVGLTFADLEDSLSSIDGDLEVLELFGVDGFESHMKFV